MPSGREGFTLTLLPSGGARRDIDARHVMRIEPVFYWEPLTRPAIRIVDRR